ncbi:MAG: hypothetical protein H2060_07715 [Azoarcus sp.]|nr:hypothetical protein [Azoarcus sp.]
MKIRLVLTFAMIAYLSLQAAPASEVIITGAPMDLREAPFRTAPVSTTLPADARAAPLRVEGEFIEVELPGTDVHGWLHIADADTPRDAVTRTFTPTDSAWTTLGQIGYPAGWTFEDLEAGHQQNFRFPLPRVAEVESATFRLGFNRIADLVRYSVLRVEVNGQPVRSNILSSDGMRWIDVPVPTDILDGNERGFIDLTLTASSLTSDDSCRTDQRRRASFLHINADSGLSLKLGESPATLAGAWERLPNRVTVSLSAQPDAASWASALAIVRQLAREHKEVRIARLPRLGDIVIAPRAEIDTAIADRPGGVEAIESADPTRNAVLLELPEGQTLVFSPDGEDWPAGLVEFGWIDAAADRELNVRAAGPIAPHPLPASLEEASFELLGAETEAREVYRSAEWRIPMGADRIPAGRVPARMRLVVNSPELTDERPMMLYAYVGDVLQDVRRLQGGREEFTLHFGRDVRRGVPEDLRLIVRRDLEIDDCVAPASGYPVQIAAGSSIVFEPQDRAPQDFGDLPRYFAAGAELIIDPRALGNAESSLVFIANLMNANRYPRVHENVHIGNPTPTPSGPFILVSDDPNNITEQSVHFDRGQIVVRRPDGPIVLNASAPRGVSVIQMVEHGEHHGLWVRPPASGRMPNAAEEMLALTFDTVAFIDNKGLALSLSPHQSDFALVTYPEHRDWLDLLGTYRYWLMALGWLVVIGLLAHLYLKVRSHKKAR